MRDSYELVPRYAPGKWAVVHYLDNIILLSSVLGSRNNKFLAKEESNASASQRFEKQPRRGRKLRTEREEADKQKINQYKD